MLFMLLEIIKVFLVVHLFLTEIRGNWYVVLVQVIGLKI